MEHHSASIGVLVVGVGFIAEQHIAAIHADPRSHLAGIVDVDAGRAAGAARANGGVPWWTDLAEALARPEVDACVVCTPNDTHTAIALAVAAAGHHLLIEKPLAIDVPGARSIAGAFAASGRVLMPAHTHRCYDYARTVKAADVGRPAFVRTRSAPAGTRCTTASTCSTWSPGGPATGPRRCTRGAASRPPPNWRSMTTWR
jgi:predicted dehydrogenase